MGPRSRSPSFPLGSPPAWPWSPSRSTSSSPAAGESNDDDPSAPDRPLGGARRRPPADRGALRRPERRGPSPLSGAAGPRGGPAVLAHQPGRPDGDPGDPRRLPLDRRFRLHPLRRLLSDDDGATGPPEPRPAGGQAGPSGLLLG